MILVIYKPMDQQVLHWIDLESKQDADQETTTQPQQEAKEKIEDEAGASEVQREEVENVEAEIQQDDEVTAEEEEEDA